MARSCPACARANGDKAQLCLYCSAPLPAISEQEALPASSEPIAAAVETRYLVILIPSGVPRESAVESFSEIAGLPLYDARLNLLATRPRLFRRVSKAVGRDLSKILTVARIPHYVVSEQSVRELPVSRIRRATLHDRHLEADVNGTHLSIPYDDLLLLVRGEIVRDCYDEKKFGSSRSLSRELSPGMQLHLYRREASAALEIDLETFDWSALGPERSDSAVLNLEWLLQELAEKAPSAKLDRGFDREPVLLTRAESSSDVASVLNSTETGASGVFRDNEAQFRFYSRWRYRLEHHLAK